MASRNRKSVAVAAALVASSVLIALAVVGTSTRRTTELAAVYPPFASSFGVAPRVQTQGLWSDANTLRHAHNQNAQYWEQQNQGIQEGLLDPMHTFAAPRRTQALRGVKNWNLDLASPRLQAAEKAQYERQKIARYNQGEEDVAWDPTTWHNVLGARKVRMQGLSQANEPWNLDGASSRLQDAEKKKYYQLRKERYNRGETNHGKYPSDEQWIMPSARGGRKMGLYQQPFAEGWKVDEGSARLQRAEKHAYLKNERQRFDRGESDGPSPWNGYDGKM